MGLGLTSTLAAAKLVPKNRPFYGYINTPEYLCFMSASFSISGIISIQHTDASERCQRRFPFPSLRVFSMWMHLKIVSTIFHSRHYKPLAFHSEESFTYWGPGTTLQSSSFLLLVLHAGEGFTYQGLRIRFISYLNLEYSAILIFFAFSISYGGEFHLSRFTNPTFWLCYLDLKCLPITARAFDPYL